MKAGTEISEYAQQPPALAPQLWLAAGYALLMALQWFRLDFGILVFSLVMPLWQLAGAAGLARRPAFGVRMAVTLIAVALFFLTVGQRFTLDTVVAFFVLAVALKWLEMRHRRDLFVMVFILLYLGAVNFLFRTGPGWALLTVTGVLLLFNALARAHVGDLAGTGTAGTWRQLLGMMATAAPVVALLFIFFPRIGPLWSVPLVSEAATGMTDQIRPGDLASLVRSDRRVFRVRFGKGGLPAPENRYWRGLFLDRFADGVWRSDDRHGLQRPTKLLPGAPAGPLAGNEYEVLLEPTYHRWAFALRGSVPASRNVYRSRQGLIRFRRSADALIRYRLGLAGGSTSQLSRKQWQYDIQLPGRTNPRTRAWAEQMARKSSGVVGFVNRILHYFHDQPFYYTLDPPTYGKNGIDGFMFGERRGFCAHYASAMAFALRAVGIPARIVVGYLGGEKGLDGRYLIVRQYDAHAWVEFWRPGKGWTRVDPTAAIAASRIEKDLRTGGRRGESGEGIGWSVAGGYRGSAAWNWVALRLDALNFAWERWVVNYHGQTQTNLFGRLNRYLGFGQLGWLVLVIVVVILTAYVGWIYRSAVGPRHDPFKRLYHCWLGVLKAGGVDLTGNETPMQAADRAQRLGATYGRTAQNFARLLSSHYYAQATVPRVRLKQLLREQKRLNRRSTRRSRV